MEHKTIEADFFDRDLHQVAKDLLGRKLVRDIGDSRRRGQIVEVEVYEGANDAASHARSAEPTERTWPMFDEPGTIYVYTIYGMYHCLNLRAPSTSGPGAILIRACAPTGERAAMAVKRGLVESVDDYRDEMDKKLMSGPGKLCQALQIGPELSGVMVGDELEVRCGQALWRDDPSAVKATKRIGLNPETCGECVDWKWRYVVEDSPWTSDRAG